MTCCQLSRVATSHTILSAPWLNLPNTPATLVAAGGMRSGTVEADGGQDLQNPLGQSQAALLTTCMHKDVQ